MPRTGAGAMMAALFALAFIGPAAVHYGAQAVTSREQSCWFASYAFDGGHGGFTLTLRGSEPPSAAKLADYANRSARVAGNTTDGLIPLAVSRVAC